MTATPVLITTDIDRTLIFSQRAASELGGRLPAEPVETTSSPATAGELAHAARDALRALPGKARMCLATSRSTSRLTRLRLPFAVHYAIAANGGVLLIDGQPDQDWSARIGRLLTRAAPARIVRELLAGHAGEPWLVRLGEEDDMCAVAVIDPARLDAGQLAAISAGAADLGWQASVVGRKLYAFPDGFGKEHAVAAVTQRVADAAGAAPLRLAAGDTEHDRAMLAAADMAWTPAGSELAKGDPGALRVTRLPGHAAAAQIAADWLDACRTAAG